MTATAKPRAAKAPPLTTGEVRAALRRTYPPASYALLEEVRNAAGFNATRAADVVMMSLWPSRGLLLTGIEIKVSRADWLRELKAPAKAEEIAQFCDRWYIAAGSADIVAAGELPDGWGLLVPHGTGDATTMRVHSEAPPLEPKPVTRGFLAAMFRRAKETGASIEELALARKEARAEGERVGQSARERAERQLKELQERVAAFEAASGVSLLHTWTAPEKIGAAVRMVLDRRDGDYKVQLKGMAERLAVLQGHVQRTLEEMGGAT